MPEPRFSVLDTLISEVEAKAADQLDPLAILVLLLKLVIASNTDPYLVAGTLVEGIAATFARGIPPEKQGEVSAEAVRLLRDRLRAYGME